MSDNKGRFVAIKLGLWLSDEICKGCGDREHFKARKVLSHAGQFVGTIDDHAPHPKPPPDFLSPAGSELLRDTLLGRKYRVSFEGMRAQIDRPWERIFSEGSGATPAEALLDAAFKALEEK